MGAGTLHLGVGGKEDSIDLGRTLVLGDVDGDGAPNLRIEIAGDHADFANLVL